MSRARASRTTMRQPKTSAYDQQQRKKRMKNNNLRVVKRKKRSVKVGSILSGLFFLVFIFYAFGYIANMLNKPIIPTTTIIRGSIDSSEFINGIIVRSERVYKSSDTGMVYYSLSNYERARRGAILATIQDEAEVNAIRDSMEELDERILKMQETRDNFSIVQDDVRRVNGDMRNILNSNMHRQLGGNLTDLYVAKSNLDKHIDLRNQMLLSEDRGSLTTLVHDRMAYQDMLNANLSNIVSEESGIISYRVDGYEEILTLDRLRNLTRTEMDMEIDVSGDATNRSVNVGDPIFKIVESNEWYIVAYIDNDRIASWREGQFTNIYISNEQNSTNHEQQVYILEINQGERESYVIMRSTRGLLDYIDKRNVKFQLTSGVYEGFKIPNTAIINRSLLRVPIDMLQESEDGTMINKQEIDRTILVPIVIKERDEEAGYVYVLQDFSSINIGDVVMSADGSESYQISELENFKGIYLINSGIAEFRRIIIDDNTPSNSSHTILDPHRNTSIRVQDRIVSDASNIEEGQTIF